MSADVKHPILIVDDEPDVLFSLKGLLRREFELYTAESGDEALEILKQHSIHVIMTDQRMPGMSGVELMNRVRTEYPNAIRMVFTGYADIKAVVEAINTGGLYRYITKPWDPDELIETLQRAAKRYEEDVARRNFSQDVRSFITDATAALAATATDDARQLLDRGEVIAQQASDLF